MIESITARELNKKSASAYTRTKRPIPTTTKPETITQRNSLRDFGVEMCIFRCNTVSLSIVLYLVKFGREREH